MIENKELLEQCVNILKAISILDEVKSHKVNRITDELADILSNKTLKLYNKYGYTSSEIDKVLDRA